MPVCHDALTRALTRSSFVMMLRAEAEAARHHGRAFGVFLADIDQLRNVNDRHGLQTGDRVIAALAQRLRTTLVRTDLHPMRHTFGRWDGGALIVLAQPCDLHDAQTLAEALRCDVAEAPIHDGIAITVSLAAAVLRIGEPIDELLARTERTLHLAKQLGRDRAEIARTPASRPALAEVRPLHGGLRRAG